MKNAAVLRVAGDICLYFSLIASFRLFAPYPPLMWLFLLAAVIGLLIAVRLSRSALRILPALLPAAVFLLCEDLYAFLILGPAFLYYFLTVLLAKFDLKHWEYQRIFRVTLILGAAVMGVAAGRKMYWAAAFAFLFLLFGVIALRNLRMGMEMPLKWKGMNLLEIFVPLGIAAGASYLFWHFLRFVKNVITVLMAPEITGILLVQEGMKNFLHFIYNLGTKEEVKGTETIAESTEEASRTMEEIVNDTELPAWMEKIHIDWVLILLLVTAAVTVLLIVIAVRRHRTEEAGEILFYEEGGKGGGRRKRKRRRGREASNAEHVRQVYRDYMELLTHYGIVSRKDTTSGDLRRQSADLFTEAPNDGLRAIYLKARYGRGETVTNEEREAADQYLEEMRNGQRT